MPEFKVVASYPDGKAETITVDAQGASALIGLRIGDEFDGSTIGKPGHRFKITGGSDSAGFPMARNIQGGALIRVMARNRKEGARRVLRRGSQITDSLVQINVVSVKKDQD
ncbi:MAG: S6e family ribosomal protein [Thermoprotei archaeon]